MKRSLLVLTACSLILCLLPLPVLAEDNAFEYGGYVRNFFQLSERDDDTYAEALARLRLRINYKHSESLAGEIAYELIPAIRDDDPLDLFLPSDPLSYRAYDLDEKIYPDDNDTDEDFVLAQNLDRAFFTISPQHFDLSIGRQPVAFGSARVINPTDIIAPYTYNTIAKEERVGVDAVRIKIPTEQLGELDIGYIIGDEFQYDESAGFIRLKSYVVMTDITFMAMVFRENYLIGLDLARSIRGAGTWLETAYVFSEEDSDENYLRLSAGSDYSFTDKLYAYVEYHFNEAGKSEPKNYLDNIRNTAYADGAVYLLAKHYLAPGFTYQITPLLIFSGQALINMNDGSFLASPIFEYSIADDVYAELGAYVGIGEESSNLLRPDSEFGLYSDTYYVSVNIYF